MRRTFLRAGQRVARATSLAQRRTFAVSQPAGMGSLVFPVMTVGALAGALASYMLSEGSNKPYAKAEELKQEIVNIMDNLDWDDGSLGPVFIRLAWHSSGTYSQFDKGGGGGSCGATMRFAPESTDGANAGLEHARNFLEPLKKKFPGVSYADLWIYAGLVAIEEMGGPHIEMRWGRQDEKSYTKKMPPNGRLPDANLEGDHIRAVFYRMGFSDQEIVALVGGGHALGRCHTDRSGYTGPWTNAPTTFSNEYFRVLFEEPWTKKQWNGPVQFEDSSKQLMMTPSDLALRDDPGFRPYAEIYWKDYKTFEKDFADAFKKLVENGLDD